MNKNKEIGKQGDHVGYMIKTNSGIIHIDKNGEWWFGGTNIRKDAIMQIGIALFGHREDATRTAQKIKKQSPDLIRWTKTIPIFYCIT